MPDAAMIARFGSTRVQTRAPSKEARTSMGSAQAQFWKPAGSHPAWDRLGFL